MQAWLEGARTFLRRLGCLIRCLKQEHELFVENVASNLRWRERQRVSAGRNTLHTGFRDVEGVGGGEITRPSAGVDAWAESMRGARTSSLIPPRVGTRFLDEHRPTCSKRQRKRGVSAHGELGVAVRCRGRGQSHGENRGAIAVRRGHGRSAEHLRWARRPRAASWMQRKADSREPWLRPCEKAKRDRVT